MFHVEDVISGHGTWKKGSMIRKAEGLVHDHIGNL
jgi:hypothetical protein